MSELLNKIHAYLLTRGIREEDFKYYDTQSVYLSMEIMEYAHRNQKCENGEEYANHPSQLLENYRDFVKIVPDRYDCIDINLMNELNIPFNGVQELCLLHDVVEYSELTFEDIENLFIECGFEFFYKANIELPLKNITHREGEDHNDYLYRILSHPNSALVKMFDFQDNLNLFRLTTLDIDKLNRSQRYLEHFFIINSKYHFIENNQKYLYKMQCKKSA